ncbi:unnamed protein product, partial [Pylaiella littoralis]
SNSNSNSNNPTTGANAPTDGADSSSNNSITVAVVEAAGAVCLSMDHTAAAEDSSTNLEDEDLVVVKTVGRRLGVMA